jgi:hypothetical protein
MMFSKFLNMFPIRGDERIWFPQETEEGYAHGFVTFGDVHNRISL